MTSNTNSGNAPNKITAVLRAGRRVIITRLGLPMLLKGRNPHKRTSWKLVGN